MSSTTRHVNSYTNSLRRIHPHCNYCKKTHHSHICCHYGTGKFGMICVICLGYFVIMSMYSFIVNLITDILCRFFLCFSIINLCQNLVPVVDHNTFYIAFVIQLVSLALCCIVPMYNHVSSLSVFSKIFQVS